MIKQALRAQKNAYAPYSNHPVGAALLTDNGKVYVGANCETANYKSNCAERSAIAAMVTDGQRKIRLLVVVGPEKSELITPCGSCRQDIREFAGKNTVICSVSADEQHYKIYGHAELLPDSFCPENLARLGQGIQKKTAARKKKKR